MKTKSKGKLRSTTRVLTVLIILFSLFMFVGEGGLDETYSTSQIIEFFFTIGIGFIGLLLAWKWELIGAGISIIGFIVFGITNPEILIFPLMYIWPLTAILFIVIWAKKRDQKLYGQLKQK